MEFLSSLFYFIIVIGILIVVHEFGHFIAARMMKIRVDIFSIGMGYRLFGWNKINGFTFGRLPKDWDGNGHTDYRLAVFPIGGYVKIAGMVDESLDTEFANQEPQPWEFRTKNMFQKSFVISAGVIMNALLTIAIFTGIKMSEGEALKATTTIGYVEKNSFAEKAGFKNNDRVISINGEAVSTWDDFVYGISLKDFGKDKSVIVERDSNKINITIDASSLIKTIAGEKALGLFPAQSAVLIGAVESLKPADKAGVKQGDTISTINGETIQSYLQMVGILRSHKEKPVAFEWKRGNQTFADTITPNSDGLIGIGIGQVYTGKIIHKDFIFLKELRKVFRKLFLLLGFSLVPLSKSYLAQYTLSRHSADLL
jgi:regulator of sigma E protease